MVLLSARSNTIGYQSRLTSKGQVTVPVQIRRKLGLRAGDRVEFAENGNETVIRRAPHAKNPFNRYKGALKAFNGDIGSINRWIADLRDEEQGNS
jgi:antitoxin PrlF